MRVLLAGMDGIGAGEIALLLAARGFTLECANRHDDATDFARRYQFDAILFDAGHDGMTGAEFVRGLRRLGLQNPALAMARAIGGRGRTRLLDAGADDVVELPCDIIELCARMRAVVRRSRGFTRSILTIGALELHMDSRTAHSRGQDIHLSRSEYKVLELLILRRGVVVSKTVLMDLLHGDLDEPDVRSLNVLMHRLRKRLAVVGLGGIVRTVWGTGYLVEEPADLPAPPPSRLAGGMMRPD